MSHTRYPFRGMVACAGISGIGPSIDFSVDELRRILDVNIIGTFVCCQEAGKEFQKQNQPASVVLIASMSGHVYNKVKSPTQYVLKVPNANTYLKGLDTAAYNSSKSAVLQLARSLAGEWGSRVGMPCVRVNTISPGYIKTRMNVKDREDPVLVQDWSEDNMLNRISDADEYRGPAMFLLSDASSFVTGSDLRVDGGHTAW